MLQATGDNDAARLYHEQALAVIKMVLGEEHLFTKITRNHLEDLINNKQS
jgi:hypothetical protein